MDDRHWVGRGKPSYVLWLEWQGFYADASRGEPQVVVRDRTVLDANPPAQIRGIRIGMSVQEARNVVPTVVRTPWQAEDYAERQRAWLDLCVPFSSRLEPIDAHIAALDLSGHPRPHEIAERVTETLVRAVGLPLRAGAGPSKWIAALAARTYDLHRAVECPASFLAPLPIEDLTPVESNRRERLAFLGYRRIDDVAALSLATLTGQFDEVAWHILQAARGTLSDPVVARYPPDVASATLAFDGPPDTVQALDAGLARLALELTENLSDRNAIAKRVELTLDHEMGEPTTFARTFTRPLATAHDLLGALRLMLPEPPEAPIERVRIRLPDLQPAQRVQLGLDDRRADSVTSLKACIQNARTVFGEDAVRQGSEIPLPRWQGVRRAYRNAYGWAWI